MAQGKQHSDESLRRVASIYIGAHRAGSPVQQTVADTLGIPLRTATKQIMFARRRGLLPSRGKLKAERDYQRAKDNLAKFES